MTKGDTMPKGEESKAGSQTGHNVTRPRFADTGPYKCAYCGGRFTFMGLMAHQDSPEFRKEMKP